MSRTVVIVDEHPHAVSVLAAAFARAGYTPRGAHTFHDAIALLEQCEPSVLVVTMELGAFNGLHLLLRASARHPAAKVIVIGPASRAIDSEARDLGAAAYVPRPFAPDSVVDLVDTLFFRTVRPFIAPVKGQAAFLR